MKWRRLGDTALWTAALEALRHHYPSAEIDVAFPAEYAALFDADPRFQSKIPLRRDGWWETVKRLRGRRYDLALAFHASRRTSTLALASGARERLVHDHSRGPREGKIPSLGVPMPAIERDLNVVRALGWTGASPTTKIFVKDEWRHRPHSKFALLGIGASRPAKQWPLERYVALARRLAPEIPLVVPCESAAIAESWRPALAGCATLVVTSTLEELLGLTASAALYIGSDSGTKHVACALGVRTLTLFGPESRGEWHGYDETRHPVIQKTVSCRSQHPEPSEFAWCGENVCPLASHACLSLISSDEVADKALGLLR